MKLMAHLTKVNGFREEQTLKEHSTCTAEYAAMCLEDIGFYYTAYLAGLIHDMGKSKAEYMHYLEDAFAEKEVVRGSVNHTFSGLIWLLEHYHTPQSSKWEKMTCEVISYAVGAHHGMFDCVDLNGKNGFQYRLKTEKEQICYEEAVSNFFAQAANEKTVQFHFQGAVNEVQNFFEKTMLSYHKKRTDVMFQLGLLTRLVLSSVIYGDRRDTAEFMNQKKAVEVTADWLLLNNYFEKHIGQLDAQSKLNQVRRDISEQCYQFALKPPGIYRLSVPTGAGKTLCSLRYALAHAEKFHKKRIIFIIPLLSVLEQNAKVIREYMADETFVLEHHSNVIRESPSAHSSEKEIPELQELVSVNWREKPIIISTMVQFLNILFAKEGSAAARFQALCDSVIVIDEIQSLPRKMTKMFNQAVNFLKEICNATIILSSATQPCFEEIDWPLHIQENADMVRLTKEQEKVFERANIIDKTSSMGMAEEELVDFCSGLMKQHRAELVICNTKSEARELFQALQKRKLPDCQLFHLSTAMCQAHRIEVMKGVKESLAEIQRAVQKGEKGKQLICVSTQMSEAGVDFSFDGVVRVLAGIDNLAQAIGRCNRSNEYGYLGTAYLVNLKNENLKNLPDIRYAQKSTLHVLHGEKQESLICETAVKEYYRCLFRETALETGYPKVLSNGEKENLADLLANKNPYATEEDVAGYMMQYPFATVGNIFTVFDEDTVDIVVPYKDGKKWIEKIEELEHSYFRPEKLKTLIEALKPYTISVHAPQVKQLDSLGFLKTRFDKRILILDDAAYDDNTGVLFPKERPVKDYMF